MRNPVDIIATIHIVTDDGEIEAVGRANAEHIVQMLLDAGYVMGETPAENDHLRAALGSALVGLQNAGNDVLLRAALVDVKKALSI
jgi:hypothetical protein